MKLLHNSVYSLLGSAVPTLVSIATIPLFVTAIGLERYGVLAIAWLVLGYFGAADFGIGRAVTQRISAMQGKERDGGQAAMASAVWSGLASMVAFGLLGAGLVFASAGWYFSGPFEVSEDLRGEILAALWILALCNPIMAISGVLSGALMGLERFRLVAIANMISSSAMMLFPLAAAWLVSTDITTLILSSLAARLVGVAILAADVWQTILRGHQLRFSHAEFHRLANFGAWITVTALVGPLMVYADRFVIGALQDAAAVAAFAIPFQIASRTQIFPLAVVQALFPRFASEAEAPSQARCRDYSAFVGLVYAPLIAGLICLSAPLLALWLGDALDPRSVTVAQIVLAGFWINAVASVPYAYIQARGNPRFTALLHVAELPLYLALLFAMGTRYGLPGYAAAFSARCALDWFLLARKAGSVDRLMLGRMVAPASLLALALAIGIVTADVGFLLFAATLVGVLAMLALAISMPPAIRQQLATLPVLRGRIGALLLMGRPPG